MLTRWNSSQKRSQQNMAQERCCAAGQPGVVVSPAIEDPAQIPEVSLHDYLLESLQANLPQLGSKPWVVDVTTGTQVRFCDVEPHSRRVASALTRRGFKKGHVLFYVTYDVSHLYVVQLAVWRLGGAVRGWYQGETPAEFARQIRETSSKFVLVDAETAPKLQEAAASLEWPVVLLSVGDVTVPGATSFSQLLEDDGTAFPPKVDINLREDVVVVPNSSGSTGLPKGVMHTHYSVMAMIHGMRQASSQGDQMALSGSWAVSNFLCVVGALVRGYTAFLFGKFQKDNFFEILNQYKPSCLIMYPYLATWMARCPELSRYDLTFLKLISVGGSVLDHSTASLINAQLPGAVVMQVYGISEVFCVANTSVGQNYSKTIKVVENQGEKCVSSGQLLPYVQAKVIDPDSGQVLERGQRGEILVRTPHLMKGYLEKGLHVNRADIDADGWLHTGDLGFFDDEGNVYVRERKSFLFKYYMHFVSPSEVESVLQEHEAVQAAGVVGVPHPETTSAARALVVLRSDCHATAAELQNYVAQRVPEHMRLHGGVRFVEKLPENRGGKLDRAALKVIATTEEEKDL